MAKKRKRRERSERGESRYVAHHHSGHGAKPGSQAGSHLSRHHDGGSRSDAPKSRSKAEQARIMKRLDNKPM